VVGVVEVVEVEVATVGVEVATEEEVMVVGAMDVTEIETMEIVMEAEGTVEEIGMKGEGVTVVIPGAVTAHVVTPVEGAIGGDPGHAPEPNLRYGTVGQFTFFSSTLDWICFVSFELLKCNISFFSSPVDNL